MATLDAWHGCFVRKRGAACVWLRHARVRAENGGGSTLEADRTSPGAWETFRIWKIGGSGVIHSGDSIALQSSNGEYVAAENGGGGEVNANRSSIGAWETLKVSFVGW